MPRINRIALAAALALLLAAGLAGRPAGAAGPAPLAPAQIDFNPVMFATVRGLPGQLLAADHANDLLAISANGGRTWRRLPTPERPQGSRFTTIALAPRPYAQPVRWLFTTSHIQPKIHRSGDFGQSWAVADFPRLIYPEFNYLLELFSRLVPSPADPTRVYALQEEHLSVCSSPEEPDPCDYQDLAILHASADGGVTWSAASPEREYIFSIHPSPLLPLRAYSRQKPSVQEGARWLRTDDGGQTWGEITIPSSYLALDPTNPNRLYTAFHRSDNGGASWSEHGFNAGCLQIGALDAHPTRGGVLFIQCDRQREPGIAYRSRDGGGTWQSLSRNFHIDQSHESRLYWIEGGVLHESFDEGDTWVETPILFEPGRTYLPALGR